LIELHIIRALLKSATFDQYSFLVDEKFLSEESEELSLIYSSIKDHHSKNKGQDIPNVDTLQVITHTSYPALPKKKRDALDAVLARLSQADAEPEAVDGYFVALRKKDAAKKLAIQSLEVAQGKAHPDSLKDLYKALEEDESQGLHASLLANRVVDFSPSLRDRDGESFSWRLASLNKSLGPIQRGDFGVVFARVETGKSTFVASEGSYMLSQAKSCVAWLANEERGQSVLRRIVQSYLGWSNQEMAANPDVVAEVYKKELRDKLQLIHKPDIHFRDAQAFFREVKPDIIIIDQLDKIVGFDEDRNDLVLGKIYQWARRISHEFAPVIGVTQASESAENKRWLHSNDMADSKTSKPAETDYLLGIGKVHEEALKSLRFLHIIKNKLPGGPDTEEEMRHGKFDLLIQPEIARYADTVDWAR
jgi:replicative DNA helicase